MEAAKSKVPEEVQSKESEENYPDVPRSPAEDKDDDKQDLEDHLNMETDRMILQEQKLYRKLSLHVGPRADAEIHVPVVTPSEQLSSQKICFSSYLERMGNQRRDKHTVKIRTPKRQRKDSATDKDVEQKKFKVDGEPKLMNIEDTAIDGIELMASYKNHLEDEEKPSTEDEKELKSEETAEEEVENTDNKDMSEREKDSFSEMEDDDKFNKSDTDNESDHGKNEKGKEQNFKNLKVKFRIRPKKRGGSVYTLVLEKESEEQKAEKTEEPAKVEEDPKPDIDVELALKQIRKGWSVHDAGDLTIGDLYLMFGARSKLELEYWWAEATPPLPPPAGANKTDSEKEKTTEKKDKGTDSSVEEERAARESDDNMFSPKNNFSQDSNDGLSGDERKCEQLASPEHKSSSSSSTALKLVSKLINRPHPAQPPANGFSQLSDRLKRLLALVGNPHVADDASGATIARCNCGHVCPPQQRKQHKPQGLPPQRVEHPLLPVFRHPSPIAPKSPAEQVPRPLNLEDLPRWSRRGTTRVANKRVVVQRLLLPTPSNIIPVKSVPESAPVPPRIRPKPSPPLTSKNSADSPQIYVLSESNGQLYFHDGDRRIPISLHTNESDDETQEDDKTDRKCDVKPELPPAPAHISIDSQKGTGSAPSSVRFETSDIGNFLPSESLSLSPSCLLRDADGWLEGTAHDFSLSSFLSHLEGRHQPDLAVDSQLQSLMAESSVDYVAKFADLAAEVTGEPNPLPTDDLQ